MMVDYSKLSDQEINLRIADILNPDSTVIESKSRPPSACITGHLPSLWVDYCNNPADAWPIIKENMISVCAYRQANYGMKEVSWWEADNFCEHITRDDNPLRAAMIVFIMMQDVKNG
ncbi:DUF2591 protein [Citrobacter phage vB_CfrS_K1M]